MLVAGDLALSLRTAVSSASGTSDTPAAQGAQAQRRKAAQGAQLERTLVWRV